MNRTHCILTAVLIVALSGAAFGQSENALYHADGNAAFLRCGPKHPSPAEARLIEEHIRFLRGKAAGKKPDKPGKPGGGNGGGGSGGEEPVLPDLGTIDIKVYFHVIRDDAGAGDVTGAQIDDQIAQIEMIS